MDREEIIQKIKNIFVARYMDIENLPGYNELDLKARQVYDTVSQTIMQDVYKSIIKVIDEDKAVLALTLGRLYGKYGDLS